MTALQELWKFIVVESHLTEKLKAVKDFYLLGRGELFLTFIDFANNILSGPLSSTTEHGMDTCNVMT